MADINTLPEYDAAKAEYDAALTVARAASDETAELRAEIAWRDRKESLRDLAEQREAAARAVEDAKTQAKQQYPLAPEVVYGMLTDPAAIVSAAQQAHAAIETARGAAGASDQGQWTRPPMGGAPPPQTPQNPLDDPNEYARVREAALRNVNNRVERKQLTDYILNRTAGVSMGLVGGER